MKNFFCILGLMLLVGCQSTSPKYLSTDELKTNYPRLAVSDLLMPKELSDFREKIEPQVAPALRSELEKRGFVVVSADRLYQIRSELRKSATDLYDPVSGEYDELRGQEIWRKALQQAKSELNVDAFLFVGITVVSAHFSNNLGNMYNAAWDGQQEYALWQEHGVGSVLGSFFVQETGRLAATSLYIDISNESDTTLSFGAGGIELLNKFDENNKAKTKSADQLFNDPAVIQQALQRALNKIDTHKVK
ncbi:hypothetical protein MN202_19625 [Rheinheimera muenzenbergensis]|uniref:Lipoprotein n=1 Tax=Rheinheimera muenzenbergensis TaxID=1193628 RepID=A0ABU8CBT5_9GAMM